MITRARVIAEVPGTNGNEWYINIPILNGIPDSIAEKNIFNAVKEKNIQSNQSLKEEDRLSRSEIIKKTVGAWSSADIESYTTKAVVCGFANAYNLVSPNDSVYVGFIDNDMGQPVILGHLTNPQTQSLTYPSLKLESLQATGNISLSSNTVFKYNDPAANNEEKQLTISDLLKMKLLLNSLVSVFPTGITGIIDFIENIITITFICNDEIEKILEIRRGVAVLENQIPIPPTNTKVGYKYIWNRDITGEKFFIDQQVEAVEQPCDYTITFSVEEGVQLDPEYANNKYDILYDQVYSLPIAIKEGKIFKYWYYTNKLGQHVVVPQSDDHWTIADNITLYPEWE